MPLDPLLRSQYSRRHSRGRDRRDTAPIKVFVAADDPAVYLTVCRAFASAGVSALSEVDFVSACGPAPEDRADLVIAESHKIPWEDLRDGKGCDSDGTQPVVVVFSEKDDPEQIERLLEAGVACCLSKSLPPELFERELRRLTAGRSAERRSPTETPQQRRQETLSGETVLWPFSGEN